MVSLSKEVTMLRILRIAALGALISILLGGCSQAMWQSDAPFAESLVVTGIIRSGDTERDAIAVLGDYWMNLDVWDTEPDGAFFMPPSDLLAQRVAANRGLPVASIVPVCRVTRNGEVSWDALTNTGEYLIVLGDQNAASSVYLVPGPRDDWLVRDSCSYRWQPSMWYEALDCAADAADAARGEALDLKLVMIEGGSASWLFVKRTNTEFEAILATSDGQLRTPKIGSAVKSGTVYDGSDILRLIQF